MRSAGIMVSQLDIAQPAFHLTNTINSIIEDGTDLDIIVYYQNWAKFPSNPRFALLMEREVWGSRCPVIATNVKLAEMLLKCPGPTKKFFYVWDFEWLRYGDYERMSQLYTNPNIELIARSEHHADVLEKVWKKPAFVMDDWNKEKLLEILT